MDTVLFEQPTAHTPVSLAVQLAGTPGRVLLGAPGLDAPGGRYSLVAAAPFLTFRSLGAECRLETPGGTVRQFGNPWSALADLVARYELLDEIDLPFPLGGVFGYWGYELRHFVEPKLPRRPRRDLELPDCHLGFYSSVVVFDHRLDRTWILATGLCEDGTRHPRTAANAVGFWREHLRQTPPPPPTRRPGSGSVAVAPAASTLDRAEFMDRVRRAQRYIGAGDIYQVNLAQRLSVPARQDGGELYRALADVSPAPFAAWLDCGDFQVVSSSPELFLRLSGREIVTRPIKGTRPRSPLPDRDTQLTYELQTSPKEMAELVMITDLLRNDLGRVCAYGSIHVPELARLERYAYVQHLVATVAGRLRDDVSHLSALRACFPGGSVTGAPKFRAMEIIDELEPVARGPYTGCLGYLGFNRESQLSIIIRTALHTGDAIHFHVGAGIVADSDPAAEYEETLAKAQGFLAALRQPTEATEPSDVPSPAPGPP